MSKIKKNFKTEFMAQNEEIVYKKQNEERIVRTFHFFMNFSSIFFKVFLYILICLFVSLGATAIFNASIREMILSYII